MKLKRLFCTLLLFTPLFSFSQYIIKGTVTDEKGNPVPNSKVQAPGTNSKTVTNEKGEFILNVPRADQKIKVTSNDSASSAIVDEGTVPVDTFPENETHAKGDADNIPTITASDEDEENKSSDAVSSALGSSRDVFANTATYNFSISRFRIRGYDDENFVTLMNGVPMNDLANGRSLYQSWSGLNDVMRNRESTQGLSPAYYSFGGIGGTFNIDSRASHQRKQLQASYSFANRAYDNRFMITYGSGISQKGWSYAVSYSRRWADEGHVEGTYYDGHSYFASVEKLIGTDHSVSLTAMGAPTESGRAKASYQELYNLLDNNYYNPNWGYQEGEKRNANVGINHQPLITFTHSWEIDEKSSMQTAVGYSFGQNRLSGLDWFNASNPLPDYYRYLPSFDPNYNPIDFPQVHQQQIDLFGNAEGSYQINWAALYDANAIHDTVYNNFQGKLAKYILGERVTEYDRFSFNTFYNKNVSEHFKYTCGFYYQQQSSEYFQEIKDLLGADFYVNLNQFVDVTNPSQTSTQQNDLNNPDPILQTGDKYGYHYVAHIKKATGWGQALFIYNHFDYMLGISVSNTQMYRDGKTRNGVFPDDSYGKSFEYTYPEGAAKGGITYKYNGRNYFFVNGMYEMRAPYFDNLFNSPRTNNRTVNADDEVIKSLEGGYLLKAPRVKGKLVGYLTQFNNETETIHFYNDDYHTFVNYTLTGINKRHLGVEAAIDVNVGKGVSASAVMSLGQFFYASRPDVFTTQDSRDTVLNNNETVYFKNVRLSNGPQSAYSLGVNYRAPGFWFLYASVNIFDGIYYNESYTRRTESALDLVEANSSKWTEIIRQKQALPGYSVDLSGGWSWRINNKFKSLKKQSFLVLNVGITNITDNQDIIVSAYESLRFDYVDRNLDKFPTRIGYAYGRTYFLNLTLRMN